ncbi:MAG: RNA polymerase sigma factor [Planctomycetota bacterium]|jgi:RNA polymerase sigma-70 factor (ECF subfamily)
MDSAQDYQQLVDKARQGDRECLKRLCEFATLYLRAYVWRLTLRHEVTQDIVQEAVVEMVKFLEQLESADKFWPWLRRIADHKLYHRQQQERRNKTVPISEGLSSKLRSPGDEGFASLVSDELRQIVLESMAALNPLHRKVLVLRCYEHLKYRDIAEEMGRSEFAVRMMFSRAKKALARNLSHRGLGKGSLLIALVLFGRMTAESKAAATTLAAVAPTLKTGMAAGTLAVLASKAGVMTLAAAGVLAVGTVVATSGPEGAKQIPYGSEPGNRKIAPAAVPASERFEECWHYFPQGEKGPVMMRAVKSDSKGGRPYCAWLQNEQANYRFDRRRRTACLENARMYRSDLSVWRLPTDEPQLSRFLSQVEGRTEDLGYTPLRGEGLLIVARSQGSQNDSDLLVVRRSHVLEKEYFQHFWPAGAGAVDNRDKMHKRGWTYFTVEGHIDGKRAAGAGRIPFVYEAGERYRPWLRLRVGHSLKIADSGTEALVYDSTGKVTKSYAGGTFFKGLTRPWMGLHTIDTVRRDAAEQQVWFDTEYEAGETKAQVILTPQEGKLVYTIDMETDVIDNIRITTRDGREGELRFAYLQDTEHAGVEFTEPQIGRGYGSKRRASPGMLWLLQLAAGDS